MPLKLTITSYQRLSPGQEPAKTLDRGSISIGRASKNDWILQDPERILSSEHCVVHCKDGGYVLTDTSTNGTFLTLGWQQGVVEGGSSGSGAFITIGPRRYVVGQLFGGTSSCENPAGVDHYGRFDTSYRTAIKNWLNPGTP